VGGLGVAVRELSPSEMGLGGRGGPEGGEDISGEGGVVGRRLVQGKGVLSVMRLQKWYVLGIWMQIAIVPPLIIFYNFIQYITGILLTARV